MPSAVTTLPPRATSCGANKETIATRLNAQHSTPPSDIDSTSTSDLPATGSVTGSTCHSNLASTRKIRQVLVPLGPLPRIAT